MSKGGTIMTTLAEQAAKISKEDMMLYLQAMVLGPKAMESAGNENEVVGIMLKFSKLGFSYYIENMPGDKDVQEGVGEKEVSEDGVDGTKRKREEFPIPVDSKGAIVKRREEVGDIGYRLGGRDTKD
jgi:hypothetical protein